MRLATTLLLLILVLGSAGYIFFYERTKPTTQEIRERSGQITHFEAEQIRSVTVRGPAGKVALRRLDGGTWAISEPFEDRADPRWVAELLVAASNLQIVETIAESEIGDSVKLDDTGLGEGMFTVEFKPADGSPVILEVGKSTPLNRTTYVREPGGNGDILVASGELYPLLATPPSDLRDRHLFRIDAATLTGISLKNTLGEIDIERPSSDELWMLTRPLQTTGHWELIDDLVAQIINLEYSGIASPEDARTFEPGQTTSVTLTPGVEGAQPVTLELVAPDGPDSEKILARISGRSPIFKIDARLKPDPKAQPTIASPILLPAPGPKILDLLNRSPNDLRDDHLANIDPAAVAAISITDLKGYNTVLKRRGEQWWLKGFDGDLNVTYQIANHKAVSDFFKTLNKERVVEFTADSAANLAQYGLDRPYLRILFAGFPDSAPSAPTPEEEIGAADSAPAPDPEFEREVVHLRIGISRDTGKIYANFLGEPFIYRIDDVLLGAAPADPLSWQSLDLLRFAYTDIKNIKIARGAEPPISVACDFNLQRFRAESGGKDVTKLLNRGRLTGLALTLSGLRAEKWVNNDKSDIPELDAPTLVVTLTIDARQRDGSTKTILTEIALTPTVPGRRTAYFYGKMNTRPEAFVIPYVTYRALASSLISDPNRPIRPGDLDDGLVITPGSTPKPVEPTSLSPDPDSKPPASPSPGSPAPATPGSTTPAPVPAEPTPSAPAPEGPQPANPT